LKKELLEENKKEIKSLREIIIDKTSEIFKAMD
jgi:hypothetical protein